jgi:hypothetical protein
MVPSAKSEAFADLLVELLETATHQILFTRGVYPERIFERCSKFGVPVLRSEHPWVNQFLGDHLRSLRNLVAFERNSGVRRVDVVLLNVAEDRAVESYVFRFDPTDFEFSGRQSSPEVLGGLDLSFRSLLLKLNSAMATLPKLKAAGGDLSFTLRLHATFAAAMEARDDLKWVLAKEKDGGENDEDWCDAESFGSCKRDSDIVPVFGMKRPFQLQITVALFPTD